MLLNSLKIRHLILASCLAPVLAVLTHAQELPDLGSPSQQVLSPAQERAIGWQFYTQTRNQPNFVKDPAISHYIQALGDRLVDNNDLGNRDFRFFVIDNAAINAFAVPGGYIGFYTGLILLADNESQLAAVLAHEIAHITRNHLARLYQKQEGVSLAAMAAVLAGILAVRDTPSCFWYRRAR